ncbi:MAG: Hsp70 family protein, partial [Leptothrix sp. (in: b-proteobacteria)]
MPAKSTAPSPAKPPRCTVGIDLGTTHTVVAWAEPGATEVQLFEIEQLVAPGEVAARPLLPSLRYHPAPGELAAAARQLPWSVPADAATGQADDPAVIGQLARRLGAQVPGRLVASAKSWLSHPGVDRLAAILPWGAPDEVAKVSPVVASASYLAHVRAAWDQRFPQRPLAEQELVLTVPASFDDSARALTLEAARLAGLPQLRLLEEPQAAFQHWLLQHRETLDAALGDARLVLVCDVGGGTTDLSLIQVERDGPGSTARLRRIAVGQHLMLGGDNMDLALAHLAESRLSGAGAAGGTRLSAAQLSQLVERCRAAKETLLAADAPERCSVTLLGCGSKLVGGARSAELGRDEVRQLLVEGFLPLVEPDATVQRRRSALVEFGLPYASDSAITRHLADFLRQHAAEMPDTLLLNGGVFRADLLAERLRE